MVELVYVARIPGRTARRTRANQMTVAFPARRKRAFITGITGQDGSYLAELLLAKHYDVHGIKRRSSCFNTERVDHLISDWHERDVSFFLQFGDLSGAPSLSKLLDRIAPDAIQHLGAQSHVRVSFDIPEYTGDVTAPGTTRLLDAIRETGIPTRFYNAASSAMFGQAYECPQTETTPFRPRSPYGCAKLYSYWMTVNVREGYGLYAVNGILFNHESPRRRAHSPRNAGKTVPRQSGWRTRLGFHARICRDRLIVAGTWACATAFSFTGKLRRGSEIRILTAAAKYVVLSGEILHSHKRNAKPSLNLRAIVTCLQADFPFWLDSADAPRRVFDKLMLAHEPPTPPRSEFEFLL